MKGKVIALMLLSLCLCSCQKKQQRTVYMGPNSIQNPTEGLRVENGNYQAALTRCQERLQQFPEGSNEAADIYSLMGGIYAEYTGDEEKARYYLDKAMDIHQRFGDDIGLARDYVQLSHIYYYIGGKIEEGVDFVDEAESLYRKNGLTDSLGLAVALTSKGRLYKKMVNTERLQRLLKKHKGFMIKGRRMRLLYIFSQVRFILKCKTLKMQSKN